MVGWGSLGPHQERSGFRFTGSVALYVDAMYRRQGIGGLLLEALLEKARERRLHCLLAVIDSKTNRAYSFISGKGSEKPVRFEKPAVNSVNGGMLFTYNIYLMTARVRRLI